MRLDVVFSPRCAADDEIGGSLCAVVDVLRATSSIVAALVGGATAVYPCVDIAEAKAGAAEFAQLSRLLGGEDRGEMIPGFDLGNSPLEYLDRGTVGGKVIFSYTSNGTGAIRRAYAASGLPVYVASLLNLSSAVDAMVDAARACQTGAIAIVCSGRYGSPSVEDTFCAGLMVERLAAALAGDGSGPQLTDSAQIATSLAISRKGQRLEVLAQSEHGRFLDSIGFGSDLEFASRLDEFDLAPFFDGKRIALRADEV